MADRAVALNPNSFGHGSPEAGSIELRGCRKKRSGALNVPSHEPVRPGLYQPFAGMAYALIELGHFDEAIVAGKKAQRQNPSFPPAYRCLASAFAHLGRDAEAREAAARLLQLDPAFTISAWIARAPGQSNRAKLLIEGLRKAGLPE